MAGEQESGRATRTAGGPRTAVIRRHRGLLFVLRFDEVLASATAAAHDARRAGDDRAWRRLSTQRALATASLGRFTEAVSLCDEVIDSVAEADDPGAVAQAWNISAIAACRSAHDDAVRRVDAALAIGEWYLAERGRADSLARAAWTAANVGLHEVADEILTRIVVDLDANPSRTLPPAALLWLRGQQANERLWQSVVQEHRGDPRAVGTAEEALWLLRRLLQDGTGLPAKTVAIFRALESYALTALGRHEESRGPADRAAEVLPGAPPDLFTSAVELVLGSRRMRGDARTATPELVHRLVRLAQWSGDLRAEAEMWRLAARSPHRCLAAAAAERFEARTAALDWRRRLQEVQALHPRSRHLREMVDAGQWLAPPYPHL